MTPPRDDTTAPTPVSLIGMGPMARAIGSILLDAGHRLTIWNRTPERASSLVERGAVLVDEPRGALLASEVVLVSLTDYAAMTAVLGAHGDALAGRTLVNLSSDTPERTRRAAAWVDDHGGGFVAGGIMVPAAALGTPEAYTFYSGDPRGLATARPVLERIGAVVAVGDDPALAQLYYQACLDVFLTALAATLHATALLRALDVPAVTFAPYAGRTLELAGAIAAEQGTAIDTGDHRDPGASTLMMGATADHVHATSLALGVDDTLPAAVKDLYDRAIAAGRGHEGWTTLYGSLAAAPAPR